jgi:hypothetical protein
MSALLSLVGALALAASPPGPCFLPSDQSAGWKRVEIPEGAPALAAPHGIDQFRSDEAALLIESDPQAYVGATRRQPGRMTYTFRVPRGAARLEVDFVDSLRGAKVDATAYAGHRAFPLLDERRVGGAALALDWSVEGVDSLVIEVHDHFREKAVVRQWRVARRVWPTREASVPEGFRAPRSLYFRHPGGLRVELCQAPDRPLLLTRWPGEGAPAPVTVTRTP